MKWLWPRQRQVEPRPSCPDVPPEPEQEEPELEEAAFAPMPADLVFQYMAPPWTPPTLMQIGGQPYLIVRAWPMRES